MAVPLTALHIEDTATMLTRLSLAICLLLFIFPSTTFAFSGYVQYVGEGGTIVWGDGSVSVVRGLEEERDVVAPGASLALRKAATKARKQLLDMILSVRIDSHRTVRSYLSGDPDLFSEVRGLVQNSLFEGPGIEGSGNTVRVSERFRDKLADLILPTTLEFQSGIPPRLSSSMEQRLDYTADAPEAAGNATAYTGVIVDARGLKVTPALAPVIYGQDGVGVYGAFLVSRGNAVHNGLVAYAKQMDLKVLTSRVGNNPLVVKGLSSYGSWRTDLVVATPMARLIQAIMRRPGVAPGCRVVVVLDKPKIPQNQILTQ